MRGLNNRVAIVTGAAGGIGREISRRFLEEGVSVIAIDVNADALKQLGADLKAD
ncbi:MAG: SDR family NAD(P)-dependent oxidoreductase, partial [Afipia sp.]